MRKITLTALLFCLVAFSHNASAQYRLVPLNSFGTNNDGTVRAGDFGDTYLTADGNRYQRGMAFNPATGHLIVVNRTPNAESINVVDALTGTNITVLDLGAQTLGGAVGFVYDQVGVAEDGAIYVGNLTTASASVQFNLYRWASETDPQTRVYGPADPGNGGGSGNTRWGDTMTVRGSGMDTEVLLGTQSGTMAALLKPSAPDMLTFTSAPLATSLSAGSLGYALAFGAPGEFYGKAASAVGNPTYVMGYDANVGVATNIYSYPANRFPGRIGALGVQLSSNWLAAVEFTPGTNADLVRLYDISAPASPPVLLDRQTVAVWTNANNIFAGSATFGFGTNVYAFNSDNGLVAFTITNGANNLPARIFNDPQSAIVQLTSNVVFAVGADGTEPLAYQWRLNGTDIASATNSSLSLTNAAQTNQGSYLVVVTNDYGSSTSAVAVLKVLASYGNTLVYEPFNYAVGSFLDGQGGWVLNTGARMPIEAGSLTVPYLARGSGNHVRISANGTTRFPIGTYSQGTLYFSFAMKLDDASATTSETMVALAVGTSTSYSPKVNIAGDGTGKYTVGVYKSSGTTSGGVATNADGSTMLFTTSDTVFVVARMSFNPGTTSDDTCDLWVNPDPSTFGALSPPTPSIGPIGAGRADVINLDRLALRDSSGYPGRRFDDVRIGFDWASVTPPATPALDIGLIGSSAKLMWPTNISTGYNLEAIRAWNDPDGWQPVTTTVVVEGTSNTVTVATGGNAKFFRLKK